MIDLFLLYPIETILITLAVIIVFFLILRWFFLWYYRINRRIELLEENNELLAKLVKHLTGEEVVTKTPGNLFVKKAEK